MSNNPVDPRSVLPEPPSTAVADTPWPYEPDEGEEIPSPTWDCPEGVCACHSPVTDEEPRRPHVLVLCDPRGKRLAGARCRVYEQGRLITGDAVTADGSGEVTVELRTSTSTLRVEWAPPDLPRHAFMPYRKPYHVRLGKSAARAADRRLSNLGFGRRRRQDNVRDYQRAYCQLESGDYRDVQSEVAVRHDRGQLPMFPPRPIAAISPGADSDVEAFYASPSRLASNLRIVPAVATTATHAQRPDRPALPEAFEASGEQNRQGTLVPDVASLWLMVSLKPGARPLSLADITVRLRPLDVPGMTRSQVVAVVEPTSPGVVWDESGRTHVVFELFELPVGRYRALAHIDGVAGASGGYAVGSADIDVRMGVLTLGNVVCALGDESAAVPPVPLTVWAAGIKTPLRFADSDARLPNPGGGDQTFGQDGWKVGVDFKDFVHLGDLLGGGKLSLPAFVCDNVLFNCGPIKENQIHRLAILAHGGPGGVDIDGKSGVDQDSGSSTDPQLLNVGTLSRYATQFAQILKALAPRARVFFMSCLAGAGKEGDEFLKAVSKLWMAKDIHVVGYKSVLYCEGARQAKKGTQGASCYPGARETHHSNNKKGTQARPYETLAVWNDLNALPWAADKSVHASIAYWGVLLRTGADGNPWGIDPSVPPTP